MASLVEVAKAARASAPGVVSKGFLSPVKGIKGGFVTRRFPEMTKSGKRQIAQRKAQAASDRAIEDAAYSSYMAGQRRSASESTRFSAKIRRDEAAARARRAAQANMGQRLPNELQGVSNRSYY